MSQIHHPIPSRLALGLAVLAVVLVVGSGVGTALAGGDPQGTCNQLQVRTQTKAQVQVRHEYQHCNQTGEASLLGDQDPDRIRERLRDQDGDCQDEPRIRLRLRDCDPLGTPPWLLLIRQFLP